MDEQPDIVSYGPRRGPSLPRLPSPGRRGWFVIGAAALVAVCLGVTAWLGTLVWQRDTTVSRLRTQVQTADQAAARASARAAAPALPRETGSAAFTLPGSSVSVVAAAITPRAGSSALTWLFVYGHVSPGQRYGILEDTCGGQYVTATDLADGTADAAGDLTIVAPNLDVSPRDGDVWIQVYRWSDGASLGGVQGPLTGPGARTFRSTAPC